MKTLLTTIFTITVLFSFSQKLNKFGAGLFYYIQPPSNYVLEGKTSYVVNGISHYDASRSPQIEKYFEIRGLTKVKDEATADLVIKVKEASVFYSKRHLKSEAKSTKNKDGTVNKYTDYHYESTCNYSYRMEIFNKEGVSIYTRNYSNAEKIIGNTSKSSSKASDNHNAALRTQKRQMLSKKLRNFSNLVNNEVAYVPKSTSTRLVKIKGKKYDYNELNSAIESVSTVTKNSSSPNVTGENVQKIEDVIKVLLANLEEKDLENKKARINKDVAAGLVYDIGFLQFMLGEFEEAKNRLEEAKTLKKNVTAAHYSYIGMCSELLVRVNAKN